MTNIEALKSAARAAIVMPAVFGFADQVVGNAQTSIFAAFGSFAVLVLVEFGGLPRARLIAYLVFTTVGVALITLGTLCSRDAWLAAGATGAVGFLTLFSGAFSGYLAAASTGAILLFVLPANIASPNSVIPDRLLGFALAASVGTAASLLLWPARRRADLRRSVAAAMRSVVELIEAGPAEQQASAAAARTAVDGLRRSSLGSQHRPAGPIGATAALAALPDELDWLLSFLEPPLALTSLDDAEAMASAAAVLRASIDRLEGGSAQADFDRLERGRDDVARAFIRQLPELPPSADPAVLPEVLDTPFRVRAATYAGRQVGLYAMRATDGNVPPTWTPISPPREATRSMQLGNWRSSTRAHDLSGSGTARAARSPSPSPPTSRNAQRSNTASGLSWARCRSCARTHSERDRRSSMRSPALQSGSLPARCS
jgi:hypothetical protein